MYNCSCILIMQPLSYTQMYMIKHGCEYGLPLGNASLMHMLDIGKWKICGVCNKMHVRNDIFQMTQHMNKLEHYPCMIDFFDLVCYLHEAKDIIKARSWGSHVMMQICALCLQNFWRCGDFITKLVLKKLKSFKLYASSKCFPPVQFVVECSLIAYRPLHHF